MLDRILILNRRHAAVVLHEFEGHYERVNRVRRVVRGPPLRRLADLPGSMMGPVVAAGYSVP